MNYLQLLLSYPNQGKVLSTMAAASYRGFTLTTVGESTETWQVTIKKHADGKYGGRKERVSIGFVIRRP